MYCPVQIIRWQSGIVYWNVDQYSQLMLTGLQAHRPSRRLRRLVVAARCIHSFLYGWLREGRQLTPYSRCGGMEVVVVQWGLPGGVRWLGYVGRWPHLGCRELAGELITTEVRPYLCHCWRSLLGVAERAWCLYTLYSVGHKSEEKS